MHMYLEQRNLTSNASPEMLHSYKNIADAILTLFENVLSIALLYDVEKSFILENQEKKYAELFGCEHLLRLFLVLPRLLDSIDVSPTQEKKMLHVINDVIGFLYENNKIVFDEKFHIFFNQYPLEDSFLLDDFMSDEDSSNRSHKSNTFEKNAKENAQEDDVSQDLLLVFEADKALVTDYIYYLFSQGRPYYAESFNNYKGKRRNLKPGTAGIACGHCVDTCSEGNTYFFSSLSSLGSIPSVFNHHLLRCPQVPYEVKNKLVSLKALHFEQRKKLRHGSITIFFNRLWVRLCEKSGMMGEGDANIWAENSLFQKEFIGETVKTIQSKHNEKNTQQNGSIAGFENEEQIFFENHIDVMNHVGKTIILQEKAGMTRAYFKYYSCLAYGSCLWTRKEIPIQRGTEWLLKEFQ